MAKVREEDEEAYVAALGEVIRAAFSLAAECPDASTDDVGTWPVSFTRARNLRATYERAMAYVR